MIYKGKKIAVMGFGRSGKACVKALLQEGAKIFVSESLKETEMDFKTFKSEWVKKFNSPQLEGEFGTHSNKILEQDMVIISPGVPSNLIILEQAKKIGLPVIGELEFAYQELKNQGLLEPTIIGVTGTNGKTTTVSLIHSILESAGVNSVVCGNIGIPLTEIAIQIFSKNAESQLPKKIPVVEISSFQLENIETFRPTVGVLLNVTPDHLNRYDSLESYREAKLRLFMNQTPQDFAVLNYEDSGIKDKLKSGFFKAQKVFFSTNQSAANIWKEKDKILYKDGENIETFSVKDLNIKWQCLLEDYLASILVVKCLKKSGLINVSNEHIIHGLSGFKGVPYRMEDIGLVKDIRVINNSMCTNPDAFVKVITGLKLDIQTGKKRITLIAGGKEKNFPITGMVEAINKSVKYCVLIGESAERLAKGLQIEHSYAKSMKEAVSLAFAHTKPGDTIILSPGFASFDWYTDFSARGDDFKKQVARYSSKIKNEKSK